MAYLHEGAELVAESGRTYLAVTSLGQDNVWIGAEKDKDDHIVILKSPGPNDAPGIWPKFQQEMTMHELFIDCPTIRKQLDRVAPGESGSPPVLVLEMIATTVWMARKKRPFARSEIVAIVKGLLQGLRDVHSKDLVYADLKMPNIMLDGFDNHTPSNGSDLTVKLGDLGEVMYPSTGTAQPIAYRAPEVFFKGEITPPADIWAVGLVLSHLLEAQTNFSETGLYNDLFNETSGHDQSAQALCSAIANDYDLKNTDYYRECDLPCSMGADHVNRWDALQDRLSSEDIAFLREILQADPRTRPTAASLLEHAWFKDDASTAEPVVAASDNADNDMAQAEPIQVIATNTEEPRPDHTTNSHAPIEFRSISDTTTGVDTVEPSDHFQTIATDGEKTSHDGTVDIDAPTEPQILDQPAAPAGKVDDTAPSEVHQEITVTSDAPPQLSPVRAFSPIVFQDINATSVPDDFAGEAASRIDKAQKRLSSRGVTSVQLNNQSLVDSKHKRESIHFQPITVGAQQHRM